MHKTVLCEKLRIVLKNQEVEIFIDNEPQPRFLSTGGQKIFRYLIKCANLKLTLAYSMIETEVLKWPVAPSQGDTHTKDAPHTREAIKAIRNAFCQQKDRWSSDWSLSLESASGVELLRFSKPGRTANVTMELSQNKSLVQIGDWTSPHESPSTPMAGVPHDYDEDQYILRVDSNMLNANAIDRVFNFIHRPREPAIIFAPKHCGKSWFLHKITASLRVGDPFPCRFAFVNLGHARPTTATSFDEFYRWLLDKIINSLKMNSAPDPISDPGYQANSWLDPLRHILNQKDTPLVLILDQLEAIYYESYCDTFFGMLREMLENAHQVNPDSNIWRRLRIIIAVDTTPKAFPDDTNSSWFFHYSPLTQIHLADFNTLTITQLLDGYHIDYRPAEVEQFMKIVGGHPYLVTHGVSAMVQRSMSMGDLLREIEDGELDDSVYQDHLRVNILNWLQGHSNFAEAVCTVLNDPNAIIDPNIMHRLKSAGILVYSRMSPPRTHTRSVFKYALYERYLHEHCQSLCSVCPETKP